MIHLRNALLLALTGAVSLPGWAAEIRGQVVDAAGNAVAQAMVQVRLQTERRESLEPKAVQADAQGAFVIAAEVAAGDAVKWVNGLAVSPTRGLGVVAARFGEPVRVELLPYRSATGVLRDQQGQPVAGAEVCVRWVTLPRKPGEEWARFASVPDEFRRPHLATTSGADGKWELHCIPQEAEVSLEVTSEQYATEQVRVPQGVEAPPPITTVLQLAGHIEGTVTNAETGQPQPDVRVVVQGFRGTDGGGGSRTDASGKYRVSGLHAGQYNVVVQCEPMGEWTAAAVEQLALAAGMTAKGTDLRLVKGVILRGSVIDGETGKPLPNVAVATYGPHCPRSNAMCLPSKTDEQGRFQFRVPPGGVWVYVQGIPEGYVHSEGCDADVTVKEGEEGEPVTLRVQRGGEVSGVVVDEMGFPVTGATVTAQQEGWSQPSTTTGKGGRFTLTGLARKGEITVAAEDKRVRTEYPVKLRGDQLPTTPLRLVMKAAVKMKVTGRVVDPDGGPLRGVAVTMENTRPVGQGMYRTEPPRQTETNEGGEFAFEEIEADSRVTLRAALGGHRYLRGGAVPEGGGETRTAEDLVLLPLGQTVSGRVVTASGEPQPDATVFAAGYLWGDPATTGADGRFTLGDLPKGRLKLVAVHGARARGIAECESGATDATLQLRETPPPDWSQAPTEADKQLALKLLLEAWEYSRDHTYYARDTLPREVARVDPAVARDMVRDLPAGNREWAVSVLLGSLAELAPESALQLLDLLDDLNSNDTRAVACATLAYHLAPRDPKLAGELFVRATQAVNPQAKSITAVFAGSYLVRAALRLGRDDADKLLDSLLEQTKQLGDQKDDMLAGLAEQLGEYPALAERLTGQIESTNEKRRAQSHSTIALLTADTAAAIRQFRTYFPGDHAITESYEARCAKRVAPALTAADPEGALALARRLADAGDRAQCFTALAAHQPDVAKAGALYEEAAAAARQLHNPAAQLARVARAAAGTNADLARKLSEEVVTALSATGADDGASEAAFYRASADPNRAWLLIERSLCRALESGAEGARAYQTAAMAMCPVNLDRAVELARELQGREEGDRTGWYCEALRKISQWLFATGPIRETMPFDRWHASDTWTPGEETHW